MLFKTFGNGNEQKIVPVIFRLVNMLFYLIEKKYEQKICFRYFQMGKYAFLNI